MCFIKLLKINLLYKENSYEVIIKDIDTIVTTRSLIKFLRRKIWYILYFFTFLSTTSIYKSFIIDFENYIGLYSSDADFQDNPINKCLFPSLWKNRNCTSPNLLVVDANVGLITAFELLVIGVTVASTGQRSINDLRI